jgi:phage terminase large subunit-like protein
MAWGGAREGQSGSKSFKKIQTTIQNRVFKIIVERAGSRNKDNIPRDFREFFLYVTKQSGLNTDGKEYFPEYLSYLAGVILHRDIDTGARIDGKRLVASTPPRHLKTTVCVAALLYCAIFYKGKKCIYLSYSDTITKEAASVFDRMARSIGFAKTGTIDKKVIGTNIIYFKSLTGGVTSLGSNHITIVDDCVKNQSDAFSPIIRNQILTSFESAVMTRTENNSTSLIVIGTRFHEKDLLGHCMINLGFESHIYPAINAFGKALFPELRPVSFLMEMKRTVGDYVWKTLYMCAPPSETSNIDFFHKKVHYISELDLNDYQNQVISVAHGVDLAYTQTKSSDLCAYIKLSMLRCGKFIVSYEISGQIGKRDLFRQIRDANNGDNFENNRIVWYASTIEAGSKEELEDYHKIRLDIRDSMGKSRNATPVSIAWNNDLIYVPDGWHPHNNNLIKQIYDFAPDYEDTVDDCIDALSAAYDKLVPRTSNTSKAPDLRFFMR